MATTFFTLSLDQVMVYEDGTEVSYATHVQNLADRVAHLNMNKGRELESNICAAVHLAADVLACSYIAEDNAPLTLLREWVISVVAGAKQGRREDGCGGFYPNLIFDLGSALDTETNPWHRDKVLRFVVAGMNGRRCCNGQKPGLAFVPTTRLVEVHAFLAESVQCNAAAAAFLDKYKDLLEFKPLVEEFNKTVREAGIDITFRKQLNEDTGANAYDIITARGEYVIAQHTGNKPVLPKATLDRLANMLANIDVVMGDDRRDSFVATVVKWNLSEYTSRVVCARPVNYIAFNTPFVNEIVGRSMYGAFPGKEVNDDVVSTQLSMLYFLE